METVCLLSREKDGHINIDLDIETLEGKCGGLATYVEIKEYVFQKYGFKVSILNIAQMKDKHGIKERVCYNYESGKSIVPECPTEKEEDIATVFRYFNMI